MSGNMRSAWLLMVMLSPLFVGCDWLPTKRTVVRGDFEGLPIGAGKDDAFVWLQERRHTLVGPHIVNPARATRGSQLGVLAHAERIVVGGGRGSEGVSVSVEFDADEVTWVLVSVPIREEYGHYFEVGTSREQVLEGIAALMKTYHNLVAFESIPGPPQQNTVDVSSIQGIAGTPLAKFDRWRVSYVDKERKRSQSLELFFDDGRLEKIVFRSSPGY